MWHKVVRCIVVLVLVAGHDFMAKAQNCKVDSVIKSYEKNTTEFQSKDSRFISSWQISHAMIKNTTPLFAFSPSFTLARFKQWQTELRKAMKEIMQHPPGAGRPAPKMLSCESRKGYRLEKWEFYPLPECASRFLVMIPNQLHGGKAPAVLCVPGSGQTKEQQAEEYPSFKKPTVKHSLKHIPMALSYVKSGLIAVVVDHAGAGEASDLGGVSSNARFHYEATARNLLELGWSYLGYDSFLHARVVEWMKSDPRINEKRIIVSGFSLGTESLMVLASLDPSLYAFVYNDFLCNTQERALVMTKPDENGARPTPNSIRHLVPNFWKYFNFPDIVCAIAPRPLILTEGGLDRDLDLVRKAYEITGHSENIEIHHYPKYSDPRSRAKIETLPEDLDRDAYYDLVNVDRENHYFKSELVIPWLTKILEKDEQ